jgi:hypothetical protein
LHLLLEALKELLVHRTLFHHLGMTFHFGIIVSITFRFYSAKFNPLLLVVSYTYRGCIRFFAVLLECGTAHAHVILSFLSYHFQVILCGNARINHHQCFFGGIRGLYPEFIYRALQCPLPTRLPSAYYENLHLARK